METNICTTSVSEITRFEVAEYYHPGWTQYYTKRIKVIARTDHYITFILFHGSTEIKELRRKIRTDTYESSSGQYHYITGCEYIIEDGDLYCAYNKCEDSPEQEQKIRALEEKTRRHEERQLNIQSDLVVEETARFSEDDTRRRIDKSATPIHEVRDLTDLPEEFRSKYSALTSLFSSVKVDALKELHQLLGDYEILSPDGRTRVLVSDDISITYLPMSSVPTSKQRVEAAKGLFYAAIELHPDWRSPKKLRELFGEDILPDGRCVEQWEHLARVARGSQEDFTAWLDDECNLENVEIAETSENNSNTIRIFKKGNIVAFLKDKEPSSC